MQHCQDGSCCHAFVYSHGHDVQVPWAKLGQVPVVIEFDKLYIVACPREEDEDTCSTQGGDDLEAAATKYEQDSKRKRVQAAEQEWIKVTLPTRLRISHHCGAAMSP